MGSSVIFAGTSVKALKKILDLNGGAQVISSTTDPTSSAVSAPIGTILLNETNGNVYRKLDAGSSTNWALIQSGSGGINYVTNGEFEVNSTGFSTYADGAAAPVDGGGGSPTLTFARTTSSPLRGTGSGLLTPGALGNGVAYGFTISRADFARMIKISFDYEIGTYASYTDGDVGVYIISASDSGFTTNIEVVQCTPYKVLKVSGQETFETVFQSHASNQYYRVCFHQITSATGYTLKIDNVVVGPQSVAYGAPIGDWKAYTPTYTGFGTVSTSEVFYRRVGSNLEIKGKFLSGTSTGTEARVSLPSGMTSQDTSIIPTIIPCGLANRANGSNYVSLIEPSVTYITFGSNDAANPYTKINGNQFGVASAYCSFHCFIPVAGWSSNVEVSSDASTRVVAAAYSGATSSTVSAGNAILYNTKKADSHSAFNTSNGVFTVPVAGNYRVSIAGVYQSFGGGSIDLYKNGSAYYPYFVGISNAAVVGASVVVPCNAGDTISVVHASGTTTMSTSSPTPVLSIERISGPAQIAASELVGVDYTGNGGTSITAAVTNIDFTTKVQDTHSSWSGTVFTAPKGGFYEFSGSVYSGNSNYVINLYKNGSLYRIARYATAASTRREFLVSLYLLAGETASLRTDTNITLVTSSSDHWLMIKSLNN